MFLPESSSLPADLSTWVLKPLFSFAGSGVTVAPERTAVEAIPPGRRREYILQERVEYAPVIDTPAGGTKAEVRILYIWNEGPVPVLNLVRMSRGTMMGVDQNRTMAWVGSSAGFTPP
jgi:hypothetical protein